MTVTTGPKISSRTHSIAGCTPRAPWAGRTRRAVGQLAARHGLRPLAAGALDEPVHALAVRRRDQRADLRLGVERVTDAELLPASSEKRETKSSYALASTRIRDRASQLWPAA